MTNSLRTFIAAALLAVGACAIEPAQAAPMTAARKAQFANLPDWSGAWGLRSSGMLSDPTRMTRETMRDHPPYNVAWEARYASDLRKAANQGLVGREQVVNTHTIYCVAGMPRNIANGFDRYYMITPEITYATAGGEMRLIYTDGRKFPAASQMNPKFQGWSIGHWEGQTLVVETRGMVAGMWASQSPLLFSDKLVAHERLTMTDKNTIDDQVTLVDPVALTAPWKFTRQYLRRDAKNWSDEKEICIDTGDRHPIANGSMGTTIPGSTAK